MHHPTTTKTAAKATVCFVRCIAPLPTFLGRLKISTWKTTIRVPQILRFTHGQVS